MMQIKVRSSSSNPAQFSDNQFVFTPLEIMEIGDVLGRLVQCANVIKIYLVRIRTKILYCMLLKIKKN